MIVDIHAHYAPKPYTDTVAAIRARVGPGPGPVRNLGVLSQLITDSPADLEGRLKLMDEAGVQKQVLSMTNGPYFEAESDGVAASTVCNDSFAELTRRYPDRFASFINLPLPHIDAALREIRRGYDELGMAGVVMNCSVFDRSTAEVEFEPLYAELNRRNGVLFFHPIQNGICSPLVNDYKFTVSIGASMEDAMIAAHLIVRQVPARYPNIKIIVPHFGGILPMLLQRLDNQDAAHHPDLPERPSVTARRFYYDTVGHGSQAALLCAWQAFGAEHLVTGSDYPVLLQFESYKRTFDYINDSKLLPAGDIDMILNRNAGGLFGWA